MKIAYFVNQYPKVSHTFIRREIVALEQLGFVIERYALRGWDADVVDAADLTERDKTHFLLRGGARGLLPAGLRGLFTNPLGMLRGVRIAVRQWRGGDRSVLLNLVSLAEACLLLEWLRRDGAAHLHVHFGTNSALIAMMVRALGGIDYSFTIHGAEEWDSPRQLRLREKVSAAKFVVAICSYTRGQLLRWIDNGDREKIAIVHCGIDQTLVNQPHLPTADVRRFVSVGRLCRDKSQLLLVAALAKLIARGVDAELVLAGDGELRAEIEAEVKRLNLQTKVRITGWIDGNQVREELLASRGLILPSVAEGLPVVIMEAMAAGRPVLSTYIAGIPELIEHGKHGWLFASGAIDEMVDAMQACLETPLDVLAAMGQANRLRVAQRHSIETEAAKLAALFRRACA